MITYMMPDIYTIGYYNWPEIPLEILSDYIDDENIANILYEHIHALHETVPTKRSCISLGYINSDTVSPETERKMRIVLSLYGYELVCIKRFTDADRYIYSVRAPKLEDSELEPVISEKLEEIDNTLNKLRVESK